MRRNIQNLIIGSIAITIIVTIIAYNYSVEQTKQRGLQFGIELDQIQNDVKDLQIQFYSEKTKWEESVITKSELLEYYNNHLAEFNSIISRYDDLDPPPAFEDSVNLLKLSSQTQLSSDLEFEKWINTNDTAAKVRSDTILQRSLNYELMGLVEFYAAKTGIEAPESNITREIKEKAVEVYDSMIYNCDLISSGFDRDVCVKDAETWRDKHVG